MAYSPGLIPAPGLQFSLVAEPLNTESLLMAPNKCSSVTLPLFQSSFKDSREGERNILTDSSRFFHV